jgi:hypothetical protein
MSKYATLVFGAITSSWRLIKKKTVWQHRLKTEPISSV